MKLNTQFAARLEKLGICIPEILMPKSGTDLAKWSVVACDQYTSDHDYWNRVEQTVGASPSTLRLTLPEIFLETPAVQAKIAEIHLTMADYLTRDLLQNQGESLMYVERTTKASGMRQGLVVAMDLERYSYAADSKSLIRATEGTIVDRIPPRLQVRRQASLEIPHIMILIDDPQKQIIEALAQRRAEFTAAYDLELMEHGGTLRGYKIDKFEHVDQILTCLESLLAKTIQDQASAEPLFFAMGDGNHSLATAKALWEEIKAQHAEAGGTPSALAGHPARYALAEIVNIHSPGLRFEPIHRVVFSDQAAQFGAFLKQSSKVGSLTPISEQAAQDLLASPLGQDGAIFYDGKNYVQVHFRDTQGKLPTAHVDSLYDEFKQLDGKARIDFIHGWNDNKKLAGSQAICFFLPVITRERLFSQVQEHGPLPRKAFSMGDAEEKRYYMESRRIVR